MSSIKPKIGICKICQKQGPVIAGLCNTHYWANRDKINAAKPKAKEKKEVGKVVGAFIGAQTLVMPENCEECGNPLPKSPPWMRRSCIAHILKKRTDYGFPSVAIHPLNVLFLCHTCHADFDNLGESHILKMKTLPLMKERVNVLLQFLNTNEFNKIPAYYL